MADIADLAQERIEGDLARAMAEQRARAAAAGAGAGGSGTGRCVDCDEPIAPARLAASPDAARCIDCQAKHERRR